MSTSKLTLEQQLSILKTIESGGTIPTDTLKYLAYNGTITYTGLETLTYREAQTIFTLLGDKFMIKWEKSLSPYSYSGSMDRFPNNPVAVHCCKVVEMRITEVWSTELDESMPPISLTSMKEQANAWLEANYSSDMRGIRV